ncbi:MAG: hypothetical protein DRQ44_09205 [Gammaproteobacteria bacterium]|nr:MAG: hypothetical protein DRQ44_09205 [Gammaproteobacteria bacterium]
MGVMRLRFFIIALLALFTSNAMAEELAVPDDKAVIQFETKIGVVAFAHLKHAGLSITQCSTCHHTLQPADTAVKPCHECHLHKSKAPAMAKTAFHDRCIGCHEYTVAGGQHAGPLKKKCKLCHIKPPKD